jgi:hypothetical protein
MHPPKKQGFRHVLDTCGHFVLVIVLIIRKFSILTRNGGSHKKLEMDNICVLHFKWKGYKVQHYFNLVMAIHVFFSLRITFGGNLKNELRIAEHQ